MVSIAPCFGVSGVHWGVNSDMEKLQVLLSQTLVIIGQRSIKPMPTISWHTVRAIRGLYLPPGCHKTSHLSEQPEAMRGAAFWRSE